MTHHLEPAQPHASPYPAPVTISPWIGGALLQLNAYLHTDDFPLPSIRSITRASFILEELADRKCREPHIVPSDSSGVVMTWSGEAGRIELTVDLMGTPVAVVFNADGKFTEQQRQPSAEWLMDKITGVA